MQVGQALHGQHPIEAHADFQADTQGLLKLIGEEGIEGDQVVIAVDRPESVAGVLDQRGEVGLRLANLVLGQVAVGRDRGLDGPKEQPPQQQGADQRDQAAVDQRLGQDQGHRRERREGDQP